MHADSLQMSKVFHSGGDVLYLLPHFQREYAWEKPNWQTLLDDIRSVCEVYSYENEPEHFMGSLVVIDEGHQNGTISAFTLVDGQQRLTTISLILLSLERLVQDTHPAIAKKIRKLLVNPDEEGQYHYKLLPTKKYDDRAAYIALLHDDDIPASSQSRIPAAHRHIHEQLSNWLVNGKMDPEVIFKVLMNCLHVVFISLDQRERPYEIFESLNAKGKPLTQADLVRNYIAMRLPSNKQEEVFDKYWSHVETLLQEKRTVGRSRLGELTAFLRHYLAMRSGVLTNEEHVYARFRDRIEHECKTTQEFINELAALRRFAEYYDRLLRPEREPRRQISLLLARLNVLEIATASPFLLALYDATNNGQLTEDNFVSCLYLLENYMVRRYLADEPANYLNKMFPTLWRELELSSVHESLRKTLASKNYPTDARLRQGINSHALYDRQPATQRKTCLVLETINRHLSVGTGGYTTLDGEATIEHIMPQNLSHEWQLHLGSNWIEVHQDYLHTLGNLTLVTPEWNSGLSNSVFAIKQPKLATHALRLNSDYFTHAITGWAESEIRERASWLLERVVEVWPMFADIPSPQAGIGVKPKTVSILGEIHTVNSWRDVVFHTANCVSQVVDNFDVIAETMPSYFKREELKYACRKLPNGWYVLVNLSAPNARNLCLRVLSAAGIPEKEWKVVEE